MHSSHFFGYICDRQEQFIYSIRAGRTLYLRGTEGMPEHSLGSNLLTVLKVWTKAEHAYIFQQSLVIK
jgi:hypothetical protein